MGPWYRLRFFGWTHLELNIITGQNLSEKKQNQKRVLTMIYQTIVFLNVFHVFSYNTKGLVLYNTNYRVLKVFSIKLHT